MLGWCEKVTEESGKVEESGPKLCEQSSSAACIIRPVNGGDQSAHAEPKGSVLHSPEEQGRNIFFQHHQHHILLQTVQRHSDHTRGVLEQCKERGNQTDKKERQHPLRIQRNRLELDRVSAEAEKEISVTMNHEMGSKCSQKGVTREKTQKKEKDEEEEGGEFRST
jgi:hypothetical protein